MGFDERWAHHCVDQLRATGVEFDDGLDDAALDGISSTFAVDIPNELRLFLQAGLPASPEWARWTDGPEVVLAWTREWINRAFSFDIRRNAYWHPLLGDRPADDEAAVEQACAFLEGAPPLIPVYAHRFVATTPGDTPRAVLAVYQAIDTIYYGNDLADYLAREFEIERPSWATAEPPPVPVWENLFNF